MKWNWQRHGWPNFRWDSSALYDLETRFLHQAGVLSGALKYMGDDDKAAFTVELISAEAVKTSEIEGQVLNRDSVQSSVRRNFGLDSDNRKVLPAEQGTADMMVDLYRTHGAALSHDKLFDWHRMLTIGRNDLSDIGRYRTHEDKMEVVSGPVDAPDVHFQAPPSNRMREEMNEFVSWFNGSAPQGSKQLPALTRASIAHLYFVCIHPFEDGNGRIGRAISEKALSQSLGQPTLIALSQTIQGDRKAYYLNLERNNKDLEITDWIQYFAETLLEAQSYSLCLIDFLIAKTKFYDRLRGQINGRQEKVITRMFRQGLEGFTGGLSAENYIAITGTSRATATRDLQDLVIKGALTRTGERRHTRYWLNIDRL